MAVRPHSKALDALADAARAAVVGAPPGEVFGAFAEAVARGTEAELVVVRILDRETGELVARALSARSPAAAAEVDGTRVPVASVAAETELAAAPAAVRSAAERVGAESALVVPVAVGGEVVATIDVLCEQPELDHEQRELTRLAAAQLALVLSLPGHLTPRETGADALAVRLAGDGLAAGSDLARTTGHVLRLALEVSGAASALLWKSSEDGQLVLDAAVGAEAGDVDSGEARDLAAQALADHEAPVGELAGRPVAALRLGEPPLGVLQLLYDQNDGSDPPAVERLAAFAGRAAHAIRATDRAREVAGELEQTRDLLAAIGEANAQLSVSHTLEAATSRLAERLRVERVAVYLREQGRLAIASARGLAGPHLPVAEALFELALGPHRGRGIVELADARAEPRLRGVVDALGETEIEAAVALPLLVRDEVIGLLAMYPAHGRMLAPNERALLLALTAQLAVAVQNARLHEQATLLGAELEQALASEREAARRLRALYEVSRSFAERMSLGDTIDAIVRAVVEQLDVDAAVIHVPDARRELLAPQAIHIAEPRLEPALRSVLFRRQQLQGSAVAEVFETRRPRILAAADVPTLAPFLETGSSAAVVPLATPSAVVAALTLVSLRPGEPLGAQVVDAAVAFGAQAALALDNARLYQQQKDFADAMQRSLLPQVRPQVTGLEVGAIYAVSARIELGGDLYDYVEVGEKLAVVLGDVTGHGVDAAADMAMAKFIFRSLAREHPSPGEFLAAANEVVVGEIQPGKFITMVYLLIDPATGDVVSASAGHPPPRIVLPDGTIEPLGTSGLALGIETDQAYEEVRTMLPPDGAVVLYTDGVVEARLGPELYGFQRLDELLARRRALKPQDVAASVIQDARRFTGGDLLDDCAVVVVKRTG